MASIITYSELKSYLQISGTSRDQLLQLLVLGVNDLVGGLTGRAWERADRTERYRGTGSKALLLKRYPIHSITDISEDGTDIDHTDTEEVEIDHEQGVLWRVTGVWVRSREHIYTIQYNAGIPAPGRLKLAALEMAAFMYRSRGGRAQIKTGDEATVLAAKSLAELPSVKEAIESHSDSARGMIHAITVSS